MKRKMPMLLVIDDDHNVLTVSSIVFRQFGFDVVSTSSPIEALHLLQNNVEIDGVISDFRMPMMNGDELAQAAKAIRPELPFFILSGTYPPDRHPVPWDDWFMKGGPIGDLIARLETVTFRRPGPCPEAREEMRDAS